MSLEVFVPDSSLESAVHRAFTEVVYIAVHRAFTEVVYIAVRNFTTWKLWQRFGRCKVVVTEVEVGRRGLGSCRSCDHIIGQVNVRKLCSRVFWIFCVVVALFAMSIGIRV